MLWIIEKMDEPIILTGLSKVFGKFTAVISLNPLNDKRSHLKKFLEEIATIGRRVRFVSAGEGKSGIDINGSEDIAFYACSEDRNGIHLNKITGTFRLVILASCLLLFMC